MHRKDQIMSEPTNPPGRVAPDRAVAQGEMGLDERRRAALRKLGRGAAYAVPATVSLMMMTRAARAS